MRTAVIAFILFGVLVDSAYAQVANGTMADSASIEMWRILASRGTPSPEALRSQVREKLLAEGRIPYRFQRVELTGVGSTDDTDATLPNMIDKQLKTSHLNENFPADQRIIDPFSLGKRITDAWNKVDAFLRKDLREALSDTRGEPSPRSKQIISQLKNVTVNELFAHSWGTEVIYLGILNGDIIPPKKLVIMGVPESNEEKWRMLAAYTGIEVHVIGFEWDKARMGGDAALKFKSGLPKDTAKLKTLWEDKCDARMGQAAACADPENSCDLNSITTCMFVRLTCRRTNSSRARSAKRTTTARCITRICRSEISSIRRSKNWTRLSSKSSRPRRKKSLPKHWLKPER